MVKTAFFTDARKRLSDKEEVHENSLHNEKGSI